MDLFAGYTITQRINFYRVRDEETEKERRKQKRKKEASYVR